jgi:hypothetical protein
MASGYRRPLFLAAGILVLTVILQLCLPAKVLATEEGVAGASIAILTAIVGFLAIATLGISVSMSVVSTAVGRFQEKYIRLLVDDPEREALTGFLMMSFTVALGDLTLLVFGVRPALVLVVPLILAVGTFAMMLGYVRSRLELFTGRGIAVELLKRRDARPTAGTLWQGDCGDDIMGLCRSDLDSGRALDAAGTLGVAFSLLAIPEPTHRLGTQIGALAEYAARNREANRPFLQAFMVLAEAFIAATPDDPWCGGLLLSAAAKADLRFGADAVSALLAQAARQDEALHAQLLSLLDPPPSLA